MRSVAVRRVAMRRVAMRRVAMRRVAVRSVAVRRRTRSAIVAVGAEAAFRILGSGSTVVAVKVIRVNARI
jgi:hypothetical protein